MTHHSPSRRRAVAAQFPESRRCGGGLAAGVSRSAVARRRSAAAGARPRPQIAPNAFIAIDTDGKVSFQIPQEEMGQGVYTSLSQLLADELDAISPM